METDEIPVIRGVSRILKSAKMEGIEPKSRSLRKAEVRTTPSFICGYVVLFWGFSYIAPILEQHSKF